VEREKAEGRVILFEERIGEKRLRTLHAVRSFEKIVWSRGGFKYVLYKERQENRTVARAGSQRQKSCEIEANQPAAKQKEEPKKNEKDPYAFYQRSGGQRNLEKAEVGGLSKGATGGGSNDGYIPRGRGERKQKTKGGA